MPLKNTWDLVTLRPSNPFFYIAQYPGSKLAHVLHIIPPTIGPSFQMMYSTPRGAYMYSRAAVWDQCYRCHLLQLGTSLIICWKVKERKKIIGGIFWKWIKERDWLGLKMLSLWYIQALQHHFFKLLQT
jgi:hypothetical protein